jgi:hypothetical protein
LAIYPFMVNRMKCDYQSDAAFSCKVSCSEVGGGTPPEYSALKILAISQSTGWIFRKISQNNH